MAVKHIMYLMNLAPYQLTVRVYLYILFIDDPHLQCTADVFGKKGATILRFGEEHNLKFIESLLECFKCSAQVPCPKTPKQLAALEAIALNLYKVEHASQLPDIYLNIVKDDYTGYVL